MNKIDTKNESNRLTLAIAWVVVILIAIPTISVVLGLSIRLFCLLGMG